jgi:hypothetical protein
MKRSVFAHSCCTTPAAMWFWDVMFAVFFAAGLLLGTVWPGLEPYGDTMILAALAAACVVNFGRNRTLHCGLTAPLFGAGAIVALLMEAGIWNVDEAVLWRIVLAGVVLAFLIEWRTMGRRQRASKA